MTNAQNDAGREETEEERVDRNILELLQELRVAGLGVQVLFGFLLALPFSARFERLSGVQRHLYIAVVLMAALATALLTAPVAYHRMVFRRHRKDQLLRMTNTFALMGLAAVALAISGAVLLVTGVVLSGPAVAVFTSATVMVFLVLWLVVPLMGRWNARE